MVPVDQALEQDRVLRDDFTNERLNVVEEEHDHDKFLYLNDRGYGFRQFVGIGTLNLETGRGELKVQPGDYILDFGVVKVVVPSEVFVLLRDDDAREFDAARKLVMEERVLNNKSGPDKFMYPIEPIGVIKMLPVEEAVPASEARNPGAQHILAMSEDERAAYQEAQAEETRRVAEKAAEVKRLAENERRALAGLEPLPPLNHDASLEPLVDSTSSLPSSTLPTLDELRAKKARGESLTGTEQARLIDGR